MALIAIPRYRDYPDAHRYCQEIESVPVDYTDF